ncbi:ExeM/NucH family extracellular endonuclease [Microbacterium sp. YY-03]|uniref:ExeM/NucH family extracellular endonuclease n=1 Tax=Microbacterium sp. YY-03 TaxID=3421636 RepID=UPI003D177780
MSSPSSTRSRRVLAPAAVAGLVLASVGISALPASAAVSVDAPVIISEVYGGGGNSGAAFNRDFIELINVSDATVDLSSWSVQYASTTGGTWQVTPLTSMTLDAGKTLLVGQATGSNTSLPGFDPDVNGTIAMSGTGGKVALVNSASALSGSTGLAQAESVIDYVGWGAATDFAGAAAPGTSNSTSISRNGDAVNTINNAADFATQTPTPQALGDGGGPVDPGEEETLTIAEIQGTGDASPYVGATVRTQGVVTAAYATGGFNGYTIQTPGTGGVSDLGSHLASDAIFIYSPATVSSVAIGDTVEVAGVVSEHFGLTEITVTAGNVTQLPAASAPLAITAAWPADNATRETLESMLYLPTESFTVSSTYTTHQYGEVGLAWGGTPLQQPTDVAVPSSAEAAAVAANNAARAVTLDDGASTNYLNSANTSLVPAYVSLSEPVTVGASATLTAPHIVDFRNDVFKLNPTSPLPGGIPDSVDFANIRPAAPAEVGGDVSVASFNVLNYFTTLGIDTASCTAYTDRAGDGVTVRGGCDQRGAWDGADFDRQQEKIVAAINGLDASVVGLMEIENSAALGEATDEALLSLVEALNAGLETPKWAAVASASNLPPLAEQDVITNAIIYQPALVTPVGAASAFGEQSGDGEAFGNAREPIAQTFVPATGGTAFTVVVNHFKSKGSAGPWPGDADTGDGQGSSVESRVRQATALRDWIATDPTGSGSSDVLLVGDFNSYGQEDPLQVLYQAGFVNAEHHYGVTDSTYVFQGLSGSLDHVLLSPSALERSTGATVWDINAGEALALEYSRYNSVGALYHEASPYRSSDHDPVLVGLNAGQVASSTSLALSASSVVAGSTVTATATVATDGDSSGTVEFVVDDVVVGSAATVNGVASLALPSTLGVGDHTVVAIFGGSATALASTSAGVTLTVTERAPIASSLSLDSNFLVINRFLPAKVTASVTVPGGSTAGTVSFYASDRLLGSAPVNAQGTAKFTVSDRLHRGLQRITAVFTPAGSGVTVSQDTTWVLVLR